MGKIIGYIVGNKWIVIAGLIAVLGVVANTYRLSAAVDREHAKLVQCEADKVVLQTNINTLSDAITHQNATIDELKRVSDAASKAADDALREVDKLAADKKQVLASLDAWKRLSGENECDATRRLLKEYKR